MKEVTFYAVIGAIFVFLLLVVLFPVISGFILQIIWSWFIVKTFHVKELTIPQAIGFSIVVHYLISRYRQEDATIDWRKYLGFMIANWIVTLGLAWIVHLFV